MFQLPTILWENRNPLLHTPPYINKTYLVNKLFKKTIFITSFLNTLTLTMNTTTTDIHTEYTQNLQTYKQHLYTHLTTHPPQDTTLTFEELLAITNDQHELPTLHKTHTNTQTPAKIYTIQLRKYINTYYI